MLRQREQFLEQLLQSGGGERATVRACEVTEHPFLAGGVNERYAERVFAAVDLLDEGEASVDEFDDHAVGVRELLTQFADDRIGRNLFGFRVRVHWRVG